MQGNLMSRRNFVGADAAITVINRASGFGIFSSAIVLAVMILPTITSLSTRSRHRLSRSSWSS